MTPRTPPRRLIRRAQLVTGDVDQRRRLHFDEADRGQEPPCRDSIDRRDTNSAEQGPDGRIVARTLCEFDNHAIGIGCQHRFSSGDQAVDGFIDAYGDIASIVRFHHERIDGEGYPDRISGDDIPLLSRIIAVADAYNAMTSNRPYREAMPSRVARLRLAQAVETQFDTSAVAAFEAILAASDEAYRTARREDFSPMPIEEPDSDTHVVIQPAANVA